MEFKTKILFRKRKLYFGKGLFKELKILFRKEKILFRKENVPGLAGIVKDLSSDSQIVPRNRTEIEQNLKIKKRKKFFKMLLHYLKNGV